MPASPSAVASAGWLNAFGMVAWESGRVRFDLIADVRGPGNGQAVLMETLIVKVDDFTDE